MLGKSIQQQDVHALIDILKKELDLHSDLFELSKAKRKIIIDNKVSELDNMVKLEQNMIFAIGQMEKERSVIVDRICVALGLKADTVTLSQLLLNLDNPSQEALSKVFKQLSGKLSEIKEVNDQNGELIKQSLEYIDYSINVITSAGMQTGSLYDDINGNGKDNSNKKRIFDTKV